MLIKHDEILLKLQKETKLPYEQLRIMFNDFWQQMLMHLQHPEDNFYKGILIRDCIKFRLNPKQVIKSYKYLKEKRPNSVYPKDFDIEKINQQLLENDIYTEKQKKIIQESQRIGIHHFGEKGHHSDEEE
jgi:hypothetical protein